MFKLSYSKLQLPYLKISSLGFFLGGGATVPPLPPPGSDSDFNYDSPTELTLTISLIQKTRFSKKCITYIYF